MPNRGPGRPRKNEAAPAPQVDKPEVLVLSVRLESGAFESTLRVPLDKTKVKEGHKAVDNWLKAIEFGLRHGVQNMEIAFKESKADA